jgi:hypothetical protein
MAQALVRLETSICGADQAAIDDQPCLQHDKAGACPHWRYRASCGQDARIHSKWDVNEWPKLENENVGVNARFWVDRGREMANWDQNRWQTDHWVG